MFPVHSTTLVLWASLIFIFLPFSTGKTRPHFIYGKNVPEILNSKSLEKILIKPALGKLVIFSNNFCKQCVLFEDTMEKLIFKVSKWRKVLAVYFFDCTKGHNIRVCGDHRVRQMPTLRFFHLDLVGYHHGFEITNLELTSIVEDLVGLLSFAEHRSLNFDVVLHNETLSNLWPDDEKIQYIVLVYQPSRSFLGLETALDMLPHKEVRVRIVEDDHILMDLTAGKKLSIFERNGKQHSFETARHSVKAYVHLLQKFLKDEGYPSTPSHQPIVWAEGADSYQLEQKEIEQYVLRAPVRIYRADLERALYKLLHIEIPKEQNLEGDSLVALKNFMMVLAKVNPLNRKGKMMLIAMHKWLEHKNHLTGEEFLLRVYTLELAPSLVFGGRHYVGCVPSKPFLREYPCSLWILFHYLTVEGANLSEPFQPGFVAKAIKGFIQHFFFECPSCAEEFLSIAKPLDVKSHDEEILWLWETHNEFNKRLEDDGTLDPEFPKIQFPSKASCRDCKDENGWMRPNVLKYLKSLYNINNLSFYGMSYTIIYQY
ncbi:sulfhydryl oxidase 2-like [Drosophila gunungcola]|uniref:sulfhydryl oxidase 2-like n=1 Tax=Drosophila gunungcola TaxID=103775 RepID=UPI0022E87D5E|nr:sulfhydryl oxidase 2-like [Drosophila gunungcola]